MLGYWYDSYFRNVWVKYCHGLYFTNFLYMTFIKSNKSVTVVVKIDIERWGGAMKCLCLVLRKLSRYV